LVNITQSYISLDNTEIVADDECVTAGEIYKCGTDKVPDVVDDMVQLAKGGPQIVIFCYILIFFQL
jgi:hypothetical protein